MIRMALLDDLDEIMEVIEEARSYLKSTGSKQWNAPDGYPRRSDLEKDICRRCCYINIKDGIIAGCVTYEGHEKEYDVCYGEWLTKGTNYTTIHRLATRDQYRNTGVGKELMVYAEDYSRNEGRVSIRIDTHPKNFLVRHLAEVLGYTECGYVFYERMLKTGEAKRLVFEKLV